MTPKEFMEKFRLRDIIEFKDYKWDSEKKIMVEQPEKYVDRIASLHVFTFADKPPEFEIWTELFPELNARLHVPVEAWIRTIERNPEPNRPLPVVGLEIGQRIIFKDVKELVDTVCGFEQAIYDDGDEKIRYTMKTYGYEIDVEDIVELLQPKVIT
jgi:hypothetical protein